MCRTISSWVLASSRSEFFSSTSCRGQQLGQKQKAPIQVKIGLRVIGLTLWVNPYIYIYIYIYIYTGGWTR